MKKKLQVFISSTYIDLLDERQAAVEAILNAGHIPAGMELFKSGNESQLQTVKRWIDESDVYLLILGGRYGTIEHEHKKSYTHIEYEYAVSKNIPVFSIVITERALSKKIEILKQEAFEYTNKDKYDEFKKIVLSKTSRFFDDIKDIKITIMETLNDIYNRFDLNGWVSGKEIKDLVNLKNENMRLLKEIDFLRIENEEVKSIKNKKYILNSGYTCDEIIKKIFKIEIIIPEIHSFSNNLEKRDLMYGLYFFQAELTNGVKNNVKATEREIFVFYRIAILGLKYGLITAERFNTSDVKCLTLSSDGYKLINYFEDEYLAKIKPIFDNSKYMK